MSAAAPAFAGALISMFAELLLQPRPAPVWKRPITATLIHLGVWLLLYTFLLGVSRRPVLSVAILLFLLLVLVVINNLKYRFLREPLIFQDFEYFGEALRHPRLYLSFFGIGKALLLVAGFWASVYVGAYTEMPLTSVVSVTDFLRAVIAFSAIGFMLLWLGARRRPVPDLDPEADLRRLGLAASLLSYALAERTQNAVAAPAAFTAPTVSGVGSELPDIVVVQSECFFDARRLFSGIRPDVLREFDAIRTSAVCHGRLQVPAWGANTVRTEFAFLSGLPAPALGVHRFNPYRRFARNQLPTIASVLRHTGYRTVCVHPYPANFYARNTVYPTIGFDCFVDLNGFRDAHRYGPYISDMAVAEKACALLQGSTQPLFLFLITMENHGPLHLEGAAAGDVERFYATPPPLGFEDLTVYLRHLANADRMMSVLREYLQQSPRAGWLCWYGDHVPILPKIYEGTGHTDGRTDYFIWGKGRVPHTEVPHDLAVEELGAHLLRQAGLLPPRLPAADTIHFPASA